MLSLPIRSPRRHALLLLAALALATAGPIGAAPPEQFRVWGTAGPDTPPPPEGWSQERATKDSLPPSPPTAEDQRRGYVLFARDTMTAIGPDAAPDAAERADALSTFAARGQYEAVSFGIYALKELRDVRVTAAELRAADGAAIAADQVDVRVARAVREPAGAKRYRVVPFLLEKRPAFAVPAGRCAQVWLTLHVPAAARAGDYTGTITITPAGGEAATLGLSLRVLPFSLPQVPIEMGMSFENPSANDAMLIRQLTDMREHGVNAMEPMFGVDIKSRDQNFGEDDVAATRASCKRRMDAIRKVFGPLRFPVIFEAGHQIAFYWDKDQNWFKFWPHSAKIESDLLKAIGVIRDMARAEGWPALRCYNQDEAGAHNLLDEAVYYYRFIKEKAPDIGSYTTVGGGMAMGHDELGQLGPWCDLISTNRFTQEIAQTLVARKKPYGVYNGCGSTPAGARFFFGFYGWKSGADQILQWAYAFDESGFWKTGNRGPDDGMVYHAPDGPLPTVQWEGVREGIDDYRAIDLLWRLAAAARASGKPDAVAAADTAEKTLKGILARIPYTYQAMAGDGRTPPPHPSTLRKWRWQVYQEIVKLQGMVPAAAVDLKGHPARPTPLELAWSEPEKDRSTFGDEMLPPSGFEDGLKPWRADAWSGKGVGTLDPAEHHSGAQSVRIDVPAGSSNQDVTVLDWPTWAGGDLKMTLDGEHTYEFSGWVKVKDRGSLPDFRFGLPDGAAASTRMTQGAPDAAGWRRIATRVTMAFRAQPSYIALWVQGPGTVWADDLSMKEIIPPPASIRLDQDEYDAADRLGVATVTVGRQMAPAQIRFRLVGADGQPSSELTVPFGLPVRVGSVAGVKGGQLSAVAPATLRESRFTFEPRALPAGQYQAQVDLLDEAGAVLATAERGLQVAGP